MDELDPLSAARSTDRPRPHTGTSETELAVYQATERLISQVPLHDLTVAQIIHAADISRATFYFYFSSKFAVLSGLLTGVMDEMFEVAQPFLSRRDDVPPVAALRQSLVAASRLWTGHRPAMAAIHEHWNTTAELRALWLGVLARFTDAVAAELDRQREIGVAPSGFPSRRLAAMLLWSTERVWYIASTGLDPDVPPEEEMVEPLMAMWTGTLYGRPGPVGPQDATSASSSV
jgi:AcrR family transcriptional regulator